MADLEARFNHLQETTVVAPGYLYPHIMEGGPPLTALLVGVLDAVGKILWDSLGKDSWSQQLTIGIAKSLYPSLDVPAISEGWKSFVNDGEAKKHIVDCLPAATEIVKDIMLDP